MVIEWGNMAGGNDDVASCQQSCPHCLSFYNVLAMMKYSNLLMHGCTPKLI
jgi:hypothetical protein